MVSRRVKRDVTRSEVGADAAAREVAGMSWEENNLSMSKSDTVLFSWWPT